MVLFVCVYVYRTLVFIVWAGGCTCCVTKKNDGKKRRWNITLLWFSDVWSCTFISLMMHGSIRSATFLMKKKQYVSGEHNKSRPKVNMLEQRAAGLHRMEKALCVSPFGNLADVLLTVNWRRIAAFRVETRFKTNCFLINMMQKRRRCLTSEWGILLSFNTLSGHTQTHTHTRFYFFGWTPAWIH